jgi:poly(A) polymerase
MAKLIDAGYTAYLVGGGVRDLLMGKAPKDFDVATSAKPEEVKKLFNNCLLIGRRFRLAHIRFGKKIIEVSTFRSGDNTDSELILRDNSFGTPEEDVLRRDFTINGLFYNPKENSIIDYVGGMPDLKKALLKTIGDPLIRFKQDPVRMLRLFKFQARLEFSLCDETRRAVTACKEELLKSSPSRVLEELLRMLESGFSHAFLKLLEEQGVLTFLLPHLELSAELQLLLQTIDRALIHNKHHLPDRSLLIAALLFPQLDKFLKKELKQQQSADSTVEDLEPQELFDSVYDFVDDFFDDSFIPLTKRLKALAHFILHTQYRLVPLNGTKPSRFRLAKHPDFPLAMQFLHLRSLLDPSLKPLFTLWKTKATQKHKK